MAILDIPTERRDSAFRASSASRAAHALHVGADPMPRPARVRPHGERPISRPQQVRPNGAALRHRGTGVLMSRASHRRRPITPATTVLLALVAAAITVWLGLVAQLGGVMGPAESVPTELAVVQVQSGETLQHVAQRIAPDAPVAEVVQQIRDLNELDSAAVEAGQTLIAPVG